MNQLHPEPGPWEEYVEEFIQVNLGSGQWGAHVKEFWSLKQERNILYILYEDMLENPKREIRKVMKFLGKDLSDDDLERICLHTSFKAMKENPTTNYTTIPSSILDQSASPFMRKGICGDWKNHFTASQSEKFDEYYQKQMSGTDLSFRFLV
ncbi:sulfotransferase 1B1-like [Dendrobates tinctorius]|uniref:sulfotransferase 1B1-like n=1 Tax=Dendrobates tinctorius TaxID=92724 RepID=UPI003CC934E3